MLYGYIRVSARDQNDARQLAALQAAGIPPDHIYREKQSGKDFDRPGYKRLLRRLRAGDVLYILSIDRLGRNYEEILEQWRIITNGKGVDIVVLDFPLLDTRSHAAGQQDLTGRFVADMVLQILAYVAQTERESIRRRQAEGIAAAKAAGKRWWRDAIPRPDDADQCAERWRAGKVSLNELGQHWGVSRTAAYKFVRHRKDD